MEVSLDTDCVSPRRSDGACPLSESRRCPVCLVWRTLDRFPDIKTCHHRSCADCLRWHLSTEISESQVDVSCPECPARFHPIDIRKILAGGERALVERYEESRRRNEGFALRRCLAADPDCRWCPAPDCGYAVIAPGCGHCPKITCGREGCGTDFCYGCRRRWHPDQTCDAAAAAGEAEERRAGDAMPCPRCASYISKTGGCDHMTCTVCGCEFTLKWNIAWAVLAIWIGLIVVVITAPHIRWGDSL